jgi:hypothetical protein
MQRCSEPCLARMPRRLIAAPFFGLDVSLGMTAICVVDKDTRRIWRGQRPSDPEDISTALGRDASVDAKIVIENDAMIPIISVAISRPMGMKFGQCRPNMSGMISK